MTKSFYSSFIFLESGFKNSYEDSYIFKFSSMEMEFKNYSLSDLNQGGKTSLATTSKMSFVKKFLVFTESNMVYLGFFKCKHPFSPYNFCKDLSNYLFLYNKCESIGILNLYESSLLLNQKVDLKIFKPFENIEVLDLGMNQLNKVWEEIKELGFEKISNKNKDTFSVKEKEGMGKLKVMTLHKKELLWFNSSYFTPKGFYSFKPNEGVSFNMFFLFGILSKCFPVLELLFLNSKDWAMVPSIMLSVSFESFFNFFLIVGMSSCPYFSMGKNHLFHYSSYKKSIVDSFKTYEIKGPKKMTMDKELETDLY